MERGRSETAPAEWLVERRHWRLLAALGEQSGTWILVVLLALVLFFSLDTPSGTFFSVFNLQTLLGDGSEIMILATGALFVIVAGGIDLSTGSIMSLGGVVSFIVIRDLGSHLDRAGQDVWDKGWYAISIGLVVGIAAGAGWGAINGL